MSAFLGPIHHWLYNKVKIQNEMAERILNECVGEENRESYENEILVKIGEFSVKPLEEIIDEINIHGWLQDKVSYVERKISIVVTNLLKDESDAAEKILDCMNNMGEEMGNQLSDITSPEAVYKILNDLLVDGMPCDHINQLTSKEEDKVEWLQTRCIHSQYWDEVKGDVANYYAIRNAFVTGLLSHTPIRYRAGSDGHYVLVKEK